VIGGDDATSNRCRLAESRPFGRDR